MANLVIYNTKANKKEAFPFNVFMFYLLLATLPFEGFVLFFIKGYPITPPLLIAILFVIISFCRILYKGSLLLDTISTMAIMTIIPALFSGIYVVFANLDLNKYLGSLSYSFFFPILFVVLSQYRFSKTEIEKLLWFLLLTSAIISCVGIYQALANAGNSLPRLYFNLTNPITGPQRQYVFGVSGTYARPTSFFAEPSWFAHYIIFIVLISSILYHKYSHSLIFKVLLVIDLVGIFVTLSFGGYLALLGALFITCFIFAGRCLKQAILMVIFFALIYFASLILDFGLISRITSNISLRISLETHSLLEFLKNFNLSSINLSSSVYRFIGSISGVLLWKYSFLTFIFGCGVGEFKFALERIYSTSLFYSGTGWTSVLSEQGLFGLIIYTLLFKYLLSSVQITYKISMSSFSKHCSFILISVIIFLILSGFTGGLGFERSLKFWVSLTLLNVIRRSLRYGEQRYQPN